MSNRYVWELPGAEAQCDSHRPGHQIHWVQFNQSMRQPGAVLPVTAAVDDDGLVHLTGDDVALVLWNHHPDLLRAALERFSGRADWKPRWHILAVPMATCIGGARSVFYLAAPEEHSECRPARRSNPENTPWPERAEDQQRALEKTWAEQEARNGELRAMDYSHIPPLRVAGRYRHGRPKPRGNRGAYVDGARENPNAVRPPSAAGRGPDDTATETQA